MNGLKYNIASDTHFKQQLQNIAGMVEEKEKELSREESRQNSGRDHYTRELREKQEAQQQV